MIVPVFTDMASRGAYVEGTDGTDYQHRERVAGQYAVSASNKYRLKLLVVIHYVLGVCHLVRLAPSLSEASTPLLLPPPSSLIEFAWLLSLPATLLAVSAIRKSRAGQLQLFQITIAITCIVPIVVTVLNDSYSLWEALNGQPAEHLVLGQPFILVWTLVLLLCLALHIGEILICRTLIKAWAPRHSKRN